MKKVKMNEMELIAMKKELRMLQDEVFSRGKWSSQEETNVGDDKGDIFEESGQKPSCFTDATKVNGDKVNEDVDISKDSEGCRQKGVKKAKVKRQYTPFKVQSVNFDGSRYGSSEFLPTTVTSSPIPVVRSSPILAGRSEPIPLAIILPIQVDCPLLGVDALKLYMTLTRVDSLYRYDICFTIISFIYLI